MNQSNLANSIQFQKVLANGLNKENASHAANGNHSHQKNEVPLIRDVWDDNFEEEFRIIMDLVDEYPIVAMDTEFPGAVYDIEDHELSPLGHYDMKYKKIKMNVDKLKVIQVGISLSDDEGNMPPGITTWQFNLRFNLSTDIYSKDAIKLLIDAGLKFDQHAKKGILAQQFAEYLIGSGLVMNREIKWIVFDGGYDFAYLIKIFEGQNLPENENQFYGLLNIYFPSFFDVKHIVRDIETLRLSGLSKLAAELNVKRFGTQHQAGSDALLTLSAFFKVKKLYMKNGWDHKYMSVLDGIPTSTDDIWRKAMVAEYPYMLFNGYGVHNMQMMDHAYYPQTDPMYNVAGANPYKMHFYPNFAPNAYQEPNQKQRKNEGAGGKSKNPPKN